MADQQTADVRPKYELRFPPDGRGVGQDEEWCEVGVNGDARRIRFHDYQDIYAIPGLYERIFYEELECQSPQVVCGLLAEQLGEEGFDPTRLRILDVGAGNGMVGEELARMGAGELVGVDIIEEAARAADRDRPGLYDAYYVLDLTDVPPRERAELEGRSFNCLSTVAALGFGDIPPRAFAEAYNLVLDEGWIAFNIKEEFLADGESSGFSRLIERMLAQGALELCRDKTYRHRLSVAGEPLHYRAMIARKREEVPERWMDA